MNINTASFDQLSTLRSIAKAAAYDLELWRPFLHWSDVESTPGFDRAKVDALRGEGATITSDGL